jgi:hypothetical protein
MNKKIAALLFALGLGAASAQALALSCSGACLRNYQACVANGYPEAECDLARLDCYDRCGI